MEKLITIIFLAALFWVFLFSMADAFARLAIYIDKEIRRFIRKATRKTEVR